MVIAEAKENYLETILRIGEKNGNVRSLDIANELGYSKPTISVAMKNLRESGYIQIDSLGLITLTSSGREIAERLYDRHKTIAVALMSIGVSENAAYTDACKIEHDISEETFLLIKNLIK